MARGEDGDTRVNEEGVSDEEEEEELVQGKKKRKEAAAWGRASHR